MKYPDELLPALQGVVPAQIATSSKDGVPNLTIVSQVFPVDAEHVAISNQFLSKCARNLREQPWAEIQVIHLESGAMWILDVRYVRSETDGDLFDRMEMQLEAIASMTGMQDIFKLQSADIFEVHGWRVVIPAKGE